MLRVLYFTVVPLGHAPNGGSIALRNTVRRLAQDPEIELSAVVAGKPASKEGTDAFLESIEIPHEFIPINEDNVHHSANTLRAIGSFVVRALFQFHWEMRSLNQPQVEAVVESAIKRWDADLLLIDYFASALFVRLRRSDARTVLVKLNREAEFYAGLLEHGEWVHGSLTRRVSLWRLARFERRIDHEVDKVIVIAASDLPKHPTRSAPACITPFLDQEQEAWRFSDTRSSFFVGNIHHFPNRLAMEWLTQALAPRLRARREDARIVIVGAEEGSIPADWRQPNVVFRGEADSDIVADLFRTADLSLCPIENDFGVKFKAAQALSFGTPLLASPATLKGLPYLSGMPRLPLEDPDAAATTVAQLIGNRRALTHQSELQLSQQAAFAATQGNVWSNALRNIPAPTDQ